MNSHHISTPNRIRPLLQPGAAIRYGFRELVEMIFAVSGDRPPVTYRQSGSVRLPSASQDAVEIHLSPKRVVSDPRRCLSDSAN